MRFAASVLGVLALTAASVVAWRIAIGGLMGEGGEQARPAPEAEAAPPQVLQALAALPSGPKFVYREFGATADAIWAALAEDPSQRALLARVEHAAGWGIRASLANDGSRLAYTARAANTGNGELWVMGLDGSGQRLLAQGADFRIAPVWAPDGSAVAFAREAGAGPSLVQVDLAGREGTLVAGGALGLYPIGYSPDGATFYYAQVTAAGTDFGAVSLANGSARLLAHVSDSIARDWRLSPDGQSIAYLAPQVAGGRVSYRAFVVPAGGGGPLALASAQAGAGDHFGPAWHPNGREVTLGRAAAGGASALEMVAAASGDRLQALAGPSRGFDVPVAWSPDGRYLVVRSFEGDSASNPGRERDVVISASGQRRQIPTEGDGEFTGWLPAGS